MNIVAGAEIHKRIAAPVTTPHSLVYFLGYARRKRRITYIGVDLDTEGAAYNHGLSLRVVDIGRNEGSSGGNLVTHKFGSDVRLDASLGIVQIFADGDIFHLGCDYTLARIMHLGNAATFSGHSRSHGSWETYVIETMVGQASLSIGTCNSIQSHGIAAALYPGLTQTRHTFLYVLWHVRVGVHAAGVIECDVLVWVLDAFAVLDCDGGILADAAHSHADVREQRPGNVYFSAFGI